MKERRSAQRHNLIMYLRVHDRATDELVGHVVDVSSGGMMLVSDAPFVPEDTHELRIILPYTEQTDRSVDVDAQCRWCGPDANEDYFDAGFQFLGANAELREIITEVVEDVGFAA
jgi:hypothetical protein